MNSLGLIFKVLMGLCIYLIMIVSFPELCLLLLQSSTVRTMFCTNIHVDVCSFFCHKVSTRLVLFVVVRNV